MDRIERFVERQGPEVSPRERRVAEPLQHEPALPHRAGKRAFIIGGTCGMIAVEPAGAPRGIGTSGPPVPGVEVRLVDPATGDPASADGWPASSARRAITSR